MSRRSRPPHVGRVVGVGPGGAAVAEDLIEDLGVDGGLAGADGPELGHAVQQDACNVETRVILPGEKALIIDRFNIKLYRSLTLTNISPKLETLKHSHKLL